MKFSKDSFLYLCFSGNLVYAKHIANLLWDFKEFGLFLRVDKKILLITFACVTNSRKVYGSKNVIVNIFLSMWDLYKLKKTCTKSFPILINDRVIM